MSEIGRVNKHKTTHQDGGDDELVLTGILPGVHKTTHQDAGADEIDATDLVGRINFVDRGDATGNDFTISSFTTDSGPHDLDLSAIIPAGAKAALIQIRIIDNLTGTDLTIYKKGNVNPFNSLYLATLVADVWHNADGLVALSTDRKITYIGTNTTFTSIVLNVRGWFI